MLVICLAYAQEWLSKITWSLGTRDNDCDIVQMHGLFRLR